MGAGELDLEHHAVLGHVAALDVDVEVGRHTQKILVVAAYPVEAGMVLTPWLVIVEAA
jgi:hypothetical protein